MKTLKKSLLLLLFFIIAQNAHSLDIEITDKDVHAFYRGEYTRGSGFLNELSAIGAIELENILAFRGGFSAGRTVIDTEINTLIDAIYSPFTNIPLSFTLSWIYNGLPEYDAHTHSIFPYVSFNAHRAGVSLGLNCRFSRFFSRKEFPDEKAQFESILSFYGYFNFFHNDLLRFGVGAGNFDDFDAGNLGAIFLKLFFRINLNENWQLVNEVKLMQSGMDGLTSNLYKTAIRSGVRFTW